MTTTTESSKPSFLSSSPQINLIACQKRKQKDIMKLLMSDYKVIPHPQNPNELTVIFNGPSESYYKTGIWDVLVVIPEQYPFKSPSIGFLNKIYHPNIDENSGSICLDVINQAWSPMFDLLNVFDIFLPQLLSYPNPKDPLNPDAAALFVVAPDIYRIKTKQYVIKYAKGDSKILNSEKFLNKKKIKEKIEEIREEEEEEDEEKMSVLSGVSDLSKTSNIELFEDGY